MVSWKDFFFNRGRISSVSRVLDCRAGGRRFNSRTEPTLRVLKWLRNGGTAFALQMARPLHGSDNHVKWRSVSSIRHKNVVSPFSANDTRAHSIDGFLDNRVHGMNFPCFYPSILVCFNKVINSYVFACFYFSGGALTFEDGTLNCLTR